jgi:magnesium chelatase subunit D
MSAEPGAEFDAVLAASLFAVDPTGTGGVCVRSQVHPARDQWLQLLRDLLPADAPLRRVPFNIADGRLLGGLDLVATLKSNRPIAERGVLALSDGGVVVVAMAERLSPHTAACLNQAIDTGEVSMAREGVSIHNPSRVGVVALDEGMSAEEFVPASLRDRMAFLLDLNGFSMRTVLTPLHEAAQIQAARRALPGVELDGDVVQALCAAALALGAGSPRMTLLAVRVARASAALEGRRCVSQDDAVVAARLVLAPRATIAPAPAPEPGPQSEPERQSETQPPSEQAPGAQPDSSAAAAEPPQGSDAPEATPPPDPSASKDMRVDIDAQQLEDMVLAAATAAIPRGLLAQLRSAADNRIAPSGSAGRVGALRNAGGRGRPAGVRSGAPGTARLNVLETLRAAAPWQRLRGRAVPGDGRIRIYAEDFRVTRHQQRAQTLTIFAVDASGSSALNRLAEAKGAVELLLADCYIRRDQVAVIGFRGLAAELLLPPTRSLVRAKRSLASLPGGGATPLASAIEAAIVLAAQALRRGETPTLVMLTDGRANVARNGATGRERGQADALQCALAVRAAGINTLFVDTSPRPNVVARDLALRMDARYIPLPFANAQALSSIVIAATPRRAAAAR